MKVGTLSATFQVPDYSRHVVGQQLPAPGIICRLRNFGSPRAGAEKRVKFSISAANGQPLALANVIEANVIDRSVGSVGSGWARVKIVDSPETRC